MNQRSLVGLIVVGLGFASVTIKAETTDNGTQKKTCCVTRKSKQNECNAIRQQIKNIQQQDRRGETKGLFGGYWGDNKDKRDVERLQKDLKDRGCK